MGIYLKAARGEDAEVESPDRNLLKIGQLAKEVGEASSTIRHWAKEGLLEVSDIAESGHQMYFPDMIKQCKLIQKLKSERYTLEEIRKKLSL